MAIRTIYEISKPSYKFYSVERAGFITVSDMAISVITDCLQLGSFTIANVQFIHSVTSERLIGSNWPVYERIVKPSDGGDGYRVNDELEVDSGVEANLKVKVTKTWSGNGTVRELLVTAAGTQADPADNDKTAVWQISNPPKFSTSFVVQGNVLNSASSQPVVINPVPNYMATSATEINNKTVKWWKAFGTDGSFGFGVAGNDFSDVDGQSISNLYNIPAGTRSRWPQTGFWSNVAFETSGIYVGQEVFLRSDSGVTVPADSRSVVPPGTFITGVYPLKVISGMGAERRKPGTASTSTERLVREVTSTYVWMTTNNPITVYKGDTIGLRGAGLKIDDTGTKAPPAFTAILQAGGAVDPLSDTVGVRGNVAQITNNSEYVVVNNLVTENTYNPFLYAGQEVTSVNPLGTIGPSVDKNAVTVVDVKKTGPTSANVKLSESITFSQAGEQLNFVFGEPQPWRICFEVLKNSNNPASGSQAMNVYAATSIQLTDTGNIANIWNITGTSIVDRAGMMGSQPTGTDGAANPNNPDEGFINREKRTAKNPEVYPLNYQLTLTDRGMFFGLWEGSWSVIQKSKTRSTTDKDAYFNWFVIQRPVNRYTGAPLTVGRCPVFCINSVGYKYWKFVVREEDILHPQQGDPDNKREFITNAGALIQQNTPYRVPADAHTQDSYAVLNTTNQIALTEDSKYLISFVYNLTSPRFRYSEEIDMIGQTSADVCMAGNDLSITAYNESGPRIYRALPSNNPYNTGLRVVALRDVTWLGD